MIVKAELVKLLEERVENLEKRIRLLRRATSNARKRPLAPQAFQGREGTYDTIFYNNQRLLGEGSEHFIYSAAQEGGLDSIKASMVVPFLADAGDEISKRVFDIERKLGSGYVTGKMDFSKIITKILNRTLTETEYNEALRVLGEKVEEIQGVCAGK